MASKVRTFGVCFVFWWFSFWVFCLFAGFVCLGFLVVFSFLNVCVGGGGFFPPCADNICPNMFNPFG